MSHLRLTSSIHAGGAGAADDQPNPAAVRFAGFTPMNDQPALADRKATFVIGAGGLLLSTTLFLVMPLDQFLRPGVWPALTLVLSFALGCLTLVAIRIAYRCYTMPVPIPPDNLLFFQNIAAGPLAAYADTLEASTAWDALHDVLDYNYTMAKLGAAKYRLTGHALTCLRIAIPLWMLLLVLISARGA
jgi:hypothetical protein